jgi:hypothetical protein
MELSLALIPPVNGLHDAPPYYQRNINSWAGTLGSILGLAPGGSQGQGQEQGGRAQVLRRGRRRCQMPGVSQTRT